MIENDAETLQMLGEVTKLVLVENREITDDTLLEKLLTAITETLEKSDASFLWPALNAKTWIVGILSDQLKMDSSSVSFGLRVLGLMASKASGYKYLQDEGISLGPVFDSVLVKFPSFDAVVRSAVLEMLISMCHYPQISSQIFTHDICEVGVRCLADESIFVTRSAQRLVAETVTNLINENAGRCSAILELLLGHLSVSVPEKSSLASLLALKRICEKREATAFLKIHHSDVADTLTRFLKCCPESLQLHCLELQVLLFDDGNSTVLGAREMLPYIVESCKPLITLKFLMFVSDRLAEFGDVLPDNLLAYFTVPIILFLEEEEDKRRFQSQGNEDWWEKLSKMAQTDDSFSQAFCFSTVCVPRLKSTGDKDRKSILVKNLVDVMDRGLNPKHFNVFGRRVQSAVLDCLQSLLKEPGNGECCLSKEECASLVRKMIYYFHNYSLTTTKLKLLNVVSETLKIFASSGGVLDEKMFEEIAEVIRRCCSDVLWDIRDGGLEILTQIANAYRVVDEESLMQWFEANKFQRLTVDLLTDEESYVRAALVKLFGSLNPHHRVWGEVNLVDIVGKILNEDPEGIVRREAAAALLRWHGGGHRTRRTYDWMKRSAKDFDWEVKLTTVAFWDSVCRKVISESGIHEINSESKAREVLEKLAETGYCDATASLVNDHDVSVRHQALKSALPLRSIIDLIPAPHEQQQPRSDPKPELRTEEDSDASRMLLDRDDVIEDILRTNYGLLAGNIFSKGPRSSEERRVTTDGNVSAAAFARILRSLDLEGLIEETGKPCDSYATDAKALLADIMANRQQERDRNLLDCY